MKYKYRSPQTSWDEMESQAIICDSYNSGIEDFEYEDLSWTVKP